jgi:hypothetical protein
VARHHEEHQEGQEEEESVEAQIKRDPFEHWHPAMLQSIFLAHYTLIFPFFWVCMGDSSGY